MEDQSEERIQNEEIRKKPIKEAMSIHKSELKNMSWIPSNMFRYNMISDFVSSIKHELVIKIFPKLPQIKKIEN